MNRRKPLEDRLADLGRALTPGASFRAGVMDRIARPARPLSRRSAMAEAVRQWLNNNSAVVTVAAVALMGTCSAYLLDTWYHDRAASASPPRAYFYDTVTHALFTEDAAKVTPFLSPGGNPAVRAHLFACGDCGTSERFTGYYERYTEAVRRELEREPRSPHVVGMSIEGREYSADGLAWVAAASPEGSQIVRAALDRCPPKTLRYCPPHREDGR